MPNLLIACNSINHTCFHKNVIIFRYVSWKMFAAILHRRYGSIVGVVREPILGRPLASAAAVIAVANSVFTVQLSTFLSCSGLAVSVASE